MKFIAIKFYIYSRADLFLTVLKHSFSVLSRKNVSKENMLRDRFVSQKWVPKQFQACLTVVKKTQLAFIWGPLLRLFLYLITWADILSNYIYIFSKDTFLFYAPNWLDRRQLLIIMHLCIFFSTWVFRCDA